MKWNITNLRSRLHLVTAIILLVGLGSAILIYMTAENDADKSLGYEVMGGHVYPVAPEDSKKYIHDLELYGGKANVIANEFMRWFDGLWHGKSLAFTVAFITILISFGFFFVSRHLTSGLKAGAPDEDKRAGSN